ncbi:MAG: phospho-sugar mutase [Myxococcota bacterium]
MDVQKRVEAWIAEDPDPNTRSELEELLREGKTEELEDRFHSSLKFGTAGLRGLLGGGPNRMNRAVVLRATAGFCRYLLEKVPDAKERGICIGFDGREMSPEFAADVAEVVAGHGIVARVFEAVAPTPLVAFSVLDRNAAGGVVVTASHNPPRYNGYKVYWQNGAQIIPPHDDGIAAKIDEVASLASIPRLSRDEAKPKGLLKVLEDDLRARYIEGVENLLVHRDLPFGDVGIAYTALHGVGESTVRAVMKRLGFTKFVSVSEQATPDGSFPTVDFPNPEEPGAMDKVLALGEREQADLVLANDPDADRLAVAVRSPDGSYVSLTGNEVGCLFAHYLLTERKVDEPLVLNTIVSSPMLRAIADAHDAGFEQTLTGFKWIANRAIDRSDQGEAFVCGYEEALGYCVGNLVRDKDGISAVALMAEIGAHCKAKGKTVLDELDAMAKKYGVFVSRQVSVVHSGTDGAARIAAIMQKLREDRPKSLGDLKVQEVTDLQAGTRERSDGRVDRLDIPPSNVLVLHLEDGHRAMARPSGTEPKIKFYFDTRAEVTGNETTRDAKVRATAILDKIAADFSAAIEG